MYWHMSRVAEVTAGGNQQQKRQLLAKTHCWSVYETTANRLFISCMFCNEEMCKALGRLTRGMYRACC